jgi:glycosyltransferase involved in cell wall biosynthesis
MNIQSIPVINNLSASKANILFIANEWFPKKPGGLERYTYELTHHLVKNQDQIELCGVGLPEKKAASLLKLTNLCEPNFSLWQRLWSTKHRFLDLNTDTLDAINLHFSLYSLPLLSTFPKHVPITFTFHGPWAFESNQESRHKLSVFIKKWIEKRVYQRCDRFIVLSKAFGTILNETYRVPWSKIHIIPGGVDISRFQLNLARQDARTQLNWPQDRPILFTPRRLVHRMGLDKLITALIQVKKQVPDVWLAIAGKGPLREALEQQVQDLKLEENVKFLGFLPDEDLPIAYQAADLTVMPSQSLEGFGLVLLESLACGTPALCTPVGGMPEVVEPFYPALVTQSADEKAIAERLIDFLTGRLELPSRQACREYAVNNFDWKAIAPRVREVLLQPKNNL